MDKTSLHINTHLPVFLSFSDSARSGRSTQLDDKFGLLFLPLNPVLAAVKEETERGFRLNLI